jgi:hypothetical protein
MGVGASTESGAKATRAPFSLHVLPYGEARAALLEAELQDNYRAKCYADRLNSIARTGQSYVAAKQTETDRAVCEQHIQRIAPREFAGLGPVEVVYLMPSADGGLPHTRPPRLICLPMSPSPVSAETLNHELWHVHQRAFPDKWARFLRDHWNFVPYHGTLPEKFHNMLRHNPDTLAHPLWLWREEWVPVCLFTNPTTPTLKDTAVWFYNTRKGQYTTSPPAPMLAFFGANLPSVAYEHPYELAAYLLASGESRGSDALRRLKEAFLG